MKLLSKLCLFIVHIAFEPSEQIMIPNKRRMIKAVGDTGEESVRKLGQAEVVHQEVDEQAVCREGFVCFLRGCCHPLEKDLRPAQIIALRKRKSCIRVSIIRLQ